jgi:hypothetical protein
MTTQTNTYAVVNELQRLLLSEKMIRFVFEHTHTLSVETLKAFDGNTTTVYDLKPTDDDTSGYMINGLSAVFLCAYICKTDPFFKGEITEPFVNAFDKFLLSKGLLKHFKEFEKFGLVIARNALSRGINDYKETLDWYVPFLKNIPQAIDIFESL